MDTVQIDSIHHAFLPRVAQAAFSPVASHSATRLLDRLHESWRYLRRGLRTQEAYARWLRSFVRFHLRPGDLRQLKPIGAERALPL